MSLSRAEANLIELIKSEAINDVPTHEFIARLIAQIQNKNREQDGYIRYGSSEFMRVFKKELLDEQYLPTLLVVEVCKALLTQQTFDAVDKEAPLRTAHVFNQLYEELVRRHQFDIGDGNVDVKVPEDINVINFEMLKHFRAAFGKSAEETMVGCILLKTQTRDKSDVVSVGTTSNVASDAQVAVVMRGLREQPELSDRYLDTLKISDQHERTASPLIARKGAAEKVKVSDRRRSFSGFFAERKPKDDEPKAVKETKSSPKMRNGGEGE